MQEILAITLQSMQSDMARLERTGVNLANTMTPGYKREVVAVRPFGEYVTAASNAIGAITAGTADDPALTRVLSDTRFGTMKHTGQKFDFAINGPGYFEVSTGQGVAYTREGTFQVDARGRLVTSQGHPVMGRDGEIAVNTLQPVVDASGIFTDPLAVDGKPLAQFRVVQFEEGAHLSRLGNGLLTTQGGTAVVEDGKVQIRQGYLENSNVSSMQEMVQLMQTMRHFESMQRVAQGYDDMLGTAIRKLSEA